MPNGETEQITFSHGGNKYSVTVPKGLSDSEAYEWAKANKPKFAALNLPSPGKGVPQGQPLTGPEGPTSIGPIPPLQRNIPQERQNLTQAGREASPIQAKIGDLEKRAGEFANIAGITALGLAGPGVGAAGAARAIPSAERAGALIGKAEQAAAGEAVHLHDVTDIVDRALQLGERGHTTPKVINDLKKAIDA